MNEENKIIGDQTCIKVKLGVLREAAEILKEEANSIVCYYEQGEKIPLRIVRACKREVGRLRDLCADMGIPS